jgi:GT2 family glycosyltransferase
MKLISVIIPTRNRNKYIIDLLDDLQNLVLPSNCKLEIIVVDQSDKPTVYNHCRYYHLSTTGPCQSRNYGVRKSKGEILIFLDDDARVESDFIKELVQPILESNYDASAGANCDVEGNYPLGEEQFFKMKSFNFIQTITANPNSPKSRPTIAIPGCCCAVTKKVFNEVGGFDESFDPTGAGEDRDFALNLFTSGYKMYYNHKARLFHIGASSGGSRDVGSRSFNLQVNTHKIAKKYFSDVQADALKYLILREYKSKIFKKILKPKLSIYHYKKYLSMKKELNQN